MNERSPRGLPASAVSGAAVLSGGLAVGLGAVQSVWTHDTFGHLAQGRAIAAHGGPGLSDPFSFWRETPQPWVDYEWGSDLLTWWLYAAGGWNALVAVAVMLAAAGAAGVIALTGRRASAGTTGSSGIDVRSSAAVIAALFTVVAMPAMRFRLTARPHLVAAPFAVLYLAVLSSDRAFSDRRRALRSCALLGVLHVVWANLHGSHLLGIALASIAALCAWPDRARAQRLGALVLALVAASCVSPWGPAMLVESIQHTLDPRFRDAMPEWHALGTLWPSWSAIYPFLLAPLLLWLAPDALRAAGPRRVFMATALFVTVAALRSLRFVPEMLVLSAPALGLELAARGASFPAKTALVALGLAVVSSAASVPLLAAEVPYGTGVDVDRMPAEAAAYLERELPDARVLARNEVGWYLEFAAPRTRVLVDGRLPFFGPAFLIEANGAFDVEGQLAMIVDAYGVDTVLLDHTQAGQATALAALSGDPAWARSWVDAHHAVYTRRLPRSDLDALPASYDPTPILEADDVQAERLRRGVEALGPGPDAQVFAAFVRSMLRLRPLARQGGWGGYRPPRTPAETAALTLARRELQQTLRRAPVPSVLAHAALAAAMACALDDAEARLADARALGESRETLFAAEELHLRRGEVGAVAAFLQASAGVPEAVGDPWLGALRSALDQPNPCPPSE